jgi:hypothetical protein
MDAPADREEGSGRGVSEDLSEWQDCNDRGEWSEIIWIIGENALNPIRHHRCHNICVMNMSAHALIKKCEELRCYQWAFFCNLITKLKRANGICQVDNWDADLGSNEGGEVFTKDLATNPELGIAALKRCKIDRSPYLFHIIIACQVEQ